VLAPDGRTRQLRFPSGLSDGSDPREAEVIRFVTALTHPNVLPVEVVRGETGRVALVCDPGDGTLAERLQHYRTAGESGVPRRELLDHLRAAAAALDGLSREYSLHHLCLTPQALVLDGPRLLLTDVGLSELLWLPAGQPVGRLNGRYSAPELCRGESGPACDQYSLAVIYQELLTGTLPFRRGAAPGKARPNLDLLPAGDRAAIARALHPDPEGRFATCTELFDALDRVPVTAARPAVVVLPPVIPAPLPCGGPAPDGPLPEPRDLIGEMVRHATGPLELHEPDTVRYLLDPGRLLRHTCGAYLAGRLGMLKLEGFRHQWNAEALSTDTSTVAMRVPLIGSFWERCLGREPALEVRLRLNLPRVPGAVLTTVHIEIRPVRCRPADAVAALERHGPALLHGLRAALQAEPERRGKDRLPFAHALGVFPVLDDQQLGEALVCQGKDVSRSGIAFFAPAAPPGSHLFVQSLLTPQLAVTALLGRVVRARRQSDGRYEVCAAFAEGPETLLRASELPLTG
jgi:hypothetical protein